jgi:hypothetical protein
VILFGDNWLKKRPANFIIIIIFNQNAKWIFFKGLKAGTNCNCLGLFGPKTKDRRRKG